VLLFFFSLVFYRILLHVCLFYVTCALDMLLIKETYLLTYLLTFLLNINNSRLALGIKTNWRSNVYFLVGWARPQLHGTPIQLTAHKGSDKKTSRNKRL